MENGVQGSLFTLSIDLELDLHQQTDSFSRRLDDVRTTLLRVLDQHQIPATWAVADPAISAATEPIRASRLGHEMAVLADQTWFGAGSGRLRLRRELSRRFERARRAGIEVSTLVLRNVDEASDIDLLVEQGITAVRGPAVDRESGATGTRSIPRADIWHLASPWQIPMQSSWWMPANWSIKRRIRQALRKQTAVHLAVDTPSLVEADSSMLEGLEELFRWIGGLAKAGQLELTTLGALGKQFVEQHLSTPSRSILRPAA
jgi:hypothetical protein